MLYLTKFFEVFILADADYIISWIRNEFNGMVFNPRKLNSEWHICPTIIRWEKPDIDVPFHTISFCSDISNYGKGFEFINYERIPFIQVDILPVEKMKSKLTGLVYKDIVEYSEALINFYKEMIRIYGSKVVMIHSVGKLTSAKELDIQQICAEKQINISPREADIITMFNLGESAKEIGNKFYITSEYVNNIVSKYRRILGKEVIPLRKLGR